MESSSSTSSLYGAGTDTAKGRQPKQIFSSVAASGVLTNDLVDIMETVKETGKREVVGCSVVVIRTLTEGIVADTVEDNIFQWNVKMSQFSQSQLDRDCQELQQKFGYDFIELQLDFSMVSLVLRTRPACLICSTKPDNSNIIICHETLQPVPV